MGDINDLIGALLSMVFLVTGLVLVFSLKRGLVWLGLCLIYSTVAGIILQSPYSIVPGLSIPNPIGGWYVSNMERAFLDNGVLITNSEDFEGFDTEFESASETNRFINCRTEIDDFFKFDTGKGPIAAEISLEAKPFSAELASRFNLEELDKGWTFGPIARYQLHRAYNDIRLRNMARISAQDNELYSETELAFRQYLIELPEGERPNTSDAAEYIENRLSDEWYFVYTPTVVKHSNNWR